VLRRSQEITYLLWRHLLLKGTVGGMQGDVDHGKLILP